MYKMVILGSKLLSRQGLYPFLRREFARIPAGANVLTVGGDGLITELLRKQAQVRGFELVTVDIDERRNPDIVADYCDESKLLAHTYDFVVLSEVLEHLYAPTQAIAQTRRLLRPGGSLILTTPFIFPLHEKPCDYFRYTRYGLQHLLRTFEEVVVRERNGWAETILVLAARLCMEKRVIARCIGVVFVFLALLAWPLARLLDLLVRVDYLTSGYLVTARSSDQTIAVN